MRILSASEVRAALPMRDAIKAMREAFGALANGRVQLPVRTAVSTPNGGGATLLIMPGRTDEPAALGAKLVSVFPRNQGSAVPVIQALVVLFDPETGTPRTILDGTSLTAIRTGAVSGLATELLARPDARHVAILGAGVQARTQLEAVRCVRTIESITIWSRTRARAEQFAAELDLTVRVAGSAAEAIRGADIVCCATPATDALVLAADVAPGTHLNAVGSFTPAMREIDPALFAHALAVVDQREAALAEAGELIAAVQRGVISPESLVELGDIVNGTVTGRAGAEQITVFKSVGLAVQDLVAGAYVERHYH